MFAGLSYEKLEPFGNKQYCFFTCILVFFIFQPCNIRKTNMQVTKQYPIVPKVQESFDKNLKTN